MPAAVAVGRIDLGRGEGRGVGADDEVAPALPQVAGVEREGGHADDQGHDDRDHDRDGAVLLSGVSTKSDHSHRNSPFPVSVFDTVSQSGMSRLVTACTVTVTVSPVRFWHGRAIDGLTLMLGGPSSGTPESELVTRESISLWVVCGNDAGARPHVPTRRPWVRLYAIANCTMPNTSRINSGSTSANSTAAAPRSGCETLARRTGRGEEGLHRRTSRRRR